MIGWLGPGAYTPPNKLTCGKVGCTNLDQEGRDKNVPALTWISVVEFLSPCARGPCPRGCAARSAIWIYAVPV